MARPKSDKPKGKSLFDHLDNIMVGKDKEYFDNLTESEKKEYSPYMINLFLSMERKYLNLMSYIDKYTFNCLSKKQHHDLLLNIIPKQKIFLKYIKKDKKAEEDELLIELLAKKLELPKKQAKELIIFLEKDDIINFMKSFAVEEKQLNKYYKELK